VINTADSVHLACLLIKAESFGGSAASAIASCKGQSPCSRGLPPFDSAQDTILGHSFKGCISFDL
jgi:hypothetical protein